MRKFTKLMLTLALLVSAVVGVKAQSGTKTPILLLKNGEINTTGFDITPISPSTLTTDNLYAATFTPKETYQNIFQYKNFDTEDYDKIIIKFGSAVPDGWTVHTYGGQFDGLVNLKDKTEYEIELTGANIDDFTIFNYGNMTPITISEVYLFKSDSEGDDIITDFDGSFYHSWSEVSATAVDNGEAGGGVVIGEEVALGGTIWGNLTGAVPYLSYANITDYSELRFEGTPGAVIRLMCNRTVNEGPIYEIKPKIGEDGKLTVKISDLKYLNGGTPCDFVCLQSIKVPAGWQGGTTAATITSIKIVKPANPLAVPKEDLSKAINSGKLWSSVGKTVESFAALTTAIANGEAELVNEDATVASLAAAQKAIEDAIVGLELVAGYTNLTQEMFKLYASVDNPGEGSTAYPAYELFTASGLPYGDSNVGELNWADLTEYNKLMVVTRGSIKPRFCINRLVKDGQQAETQEDSKMLDINPNNGFTWSTEKYQTIDGNVYTIDLTKIVGDYSFARLHSIKKQGYGEGVFVTDMLLYQSRPVTVGEAGYTTFSTDKAVKLEDVTGYAAKYENGKLNLTAVTEVPAGAGIIIEAAEGSYELPVIASADALDNDLLVSDGTVTGNGNIFALANGTKGVGFYKVANGQAVPAGKAYLNIAAEAREFIGFGGEATGIKMVENAAANNGEVFNLAGQRVAQPTKGLYIMNGKKVVIK